MLDGRTDLAKYSHGCSVLLNEIPTAHGPVYRRPGTRFVEDCNDVAPVLLPFVFNRTQSYVLAFLGAGGIAVYSDRGRVLTSGGAEYSFGYGLWDVPPRRADGTSRLSYTQSGDTLFVCDAEGGFPLMAIVRHNHNDWSIAPYGMGVPPAGDWKNEYCLLYKTKNDGTIAPEGQYYLAVNVGEVSSSFGWTAPGQWMETTNLSPADMTSNFFKARRRGKVFLDLMARIGRDVTANPTYDPVYSATLAASTGRVVSYYTGMYATHGQLISHNGRLYEPRIQGVVPSEPLHESQSGVVQTGLFYLGNGKVCFEIVESGIEDSIHDSDGTTSAIYCALVKIADHPDNYDFINGRAFERYTSAYIQTLGTSRQKDAMTHFKCYRWAEAAVRDFVPEVMVTPLPTIGEVPDNVSIFRERLVLSVNRRQHMSVAGDFPNFSAYDGSGHVVADCALDLDLLSGDLSPVSWMAPSRNLVLGSFGGERSIGEQNISNAFGPTNVKVDVSSSYGSRDVPPAIVGSDVLYIDRSGRRVRRSGLALDPQDAADLSILSEHIGAESPFIDSAWQQSPSSILWLVQADGGLCGLTYDRTQDVVAWHRHDIGGTVFSICSIPSPDGTRDDLWLVVRRGLGSDTVTYLEVMPDDFTLGRSVADQCFLDCSLTYDGSATLTISGLDHLKGQTVQALAHGFVIPDLIVSNAGVVTLPSMYEKVHIGLHHPSRIRTMRLEKSPDGVSQGKIGRIHRVVLRLMDSVGVKVGPSFTKMDLKEFRIATMAMDTAVPIQTLDLSCDFPGDYEEANYVCIEQGQPLPLTILSAAIEFELQT